MSARMHFAIIILFGLLLFSCQEQDEVDAQIPEGTYEGVFFRSAPNIKFMPANVTITFEGNRFIGGSDQMYYLAICEGTYSINGNSVEFTNTCVWQANFDWTYILCGKYEIREEGEEILLSRSLGNHTYDTYRLKLKQ